MKKIRVLIVDDSAVTRKRLTDILSAAPELEVAGTAIDPYIAVNKIKSLQPDVLTLDVEMPRMDGITFLSKLMIAQPMPVVMVSSLTEAGARETVRALELGAIDFILKPRMDDPEGWARFGDDLVEKLCAAHGAKVSRKKANPNMSLGASPIQVEEKFSADVIVARKRTAVAKVRSDTIVGIGASTGGTEAIAEILTRLHENTPGIVIVQHMPEKFTRAFADRVNGNCRLYVKEAEHGDRVYRGTALIAPGNRHMLVAADNDGYFVQINDGPPVNRHRPAVDVLFRSLSNVAGANAIGIELTGMGDDGARGLLEMREAGAVTIAQDEASCVVFGMPREAIKRDAAAMVKNPAQIADYLNGLPGVT